MSFRGIQVYSDHPVRDSAKISGLSSNNAVEADAPLARLIDDRQTTLMQFSTAETDHHIDIDMGAGFTGQPDTIIIPAGHSLDGIVTGLWADTFTPPTTFRTGATPSGDGVIKIEFTPGGPWRYWRVTFATLGAHALGGIILATKKTFTSFNKVRDEDDFLQHSYTELARPSGVAPRVQNGIPRRVLNPVFEHALSGANLVTANSWVDDVGMHRPFWMDPQSTSATPDVDDPVLQFKFVNDPRRRWGAGGASRGVDRKTFDFRMIQSVD